ncbi:HTH-type transcriptional repressor NsrR [Bienertia sinuspersici]
MSPTPLKKFISYGLTEAQIRDVMSIGFRSFSDFDIDEMPSDLCRWLIRHFNPFLSSVKLKHAHLDIGIHDFHIVFGLPNFGNSVQLAGSREKSLEYNTLVGDWLEHLGKERSNVTIGDIVGEQCLGQGLLELLNCPLAWEFTQPFSKLRPGRKKVSDLTSSLDSIVEPGLVDRDLPKEEVLIIASILWWSGFFKRYGPGRGRMELSIHDSRKNAFN